MATAQPVVQSEQCPQKRHLIAGLLEAHTSIVAIHDREVAALLNGDLRADAVLTEDLAAARKHRDTIYQRLREHLAAHGC